jgi:hypothetical protein
MLEDLLGIFSMSFFDFDFFAMAGCELNHHQANLCAFVWQVVACSRKVLQATWVMQRQSLAGT